MLDTERSHLCYENRLSGQRHGVPQLGQFIHHPFEVSLVGSILALEELLLIV